MSEAIQAAREAWQAARSDEAEARARLVDALHTAREAGATLEQLADELGTTRQYVHKLLKGKR